jgi:peptidoglycan LD-endopeptidase CwlK
MINSRDLDDLHPLVAAKARDFLARCHAEGIDILVTSTYRDAEAQAKLYAQGRTSPGKIVTRAKPRPVVPQLARRLRHRPVTPW